MATLRRIHNAVSAVFAVEGADPNEASQTLDEVMAILSGEAVEQLEVFGQWMTNYLAGTPAETAVTERLRSAREVKSMFETKLREYGERLKEEARKEGRKEGRREGRLEGRLEGRREAARALKEQGVNVEIIARATGLSAEEIEAL